MPALFGLNIDEALLLNDVVLDVLSVIIMLVKLMGVSVILVVLVVSMLVVVVQEFRHPVAPLDQIQYLMRLLQLGEVLGEAMP